MGYTYGHIMEWLLKLDILYFYFLIVKVTHFYCRKLKTNQKIIKKKMHTINTYIVKCQIETNNWHGFVFVFTYCKARKHMTSKIYLFTKWKPYCWGWIWLIFQSSHLSAEHNWWWGWIMWLSLFSWAWLEIWSFRNFHLLCFWLSTQSPWQATCSSSLPLAPAGLWHLPCTFSCFTYPSWMAAVLHAWPPKC